MKTTIAVIVILTIFSSADYYIYTRTMQAFDAVISPSWVTLIVFLFFITALPVGKIIEQFSIGPLSNTLVTIGSFTFGFLFYALLISV
ncbi:MAG: hypothetical protein U9N85_12215 [Bacteroidota bacterium]|nr:hypothetical protein [Bacteroidota bacterium]